MRNKLFIGGQKVQTKSGNRTTTVTSDRIEITVGDARAGRRMAATIKNEVQADIRAIREPVSEATLERRKYGSKYDDISPFIGDAEKMLDKMLSGKQVRKKRQRKHLGKGYYANDKGHLADYMRVFWSPKTWAVEIWEARAPIDRFIPKVFGTDAKYLTFRNKLASLCETLRNPLSVWSRPRVVAAVEREAAKAVKIVRVK